MDSMPLDNGRPSNMRPFEVNQSLPAPSIFSRRTRAGNRGIETDLEAQDSGDQSTGEINGDEGSASLWLFGRWDKRHYEVATKVLLVLHVVRLLYDFYPKSAA